MSACQCSVCRNPAGDTETKGRHLAAHRTFEAIVAERPDWHFRRPTLRQIVAWNAQEWDVPGTCPRREHAALPRHPQHAA